MKIICPNCGADYNISANKIPSEGLQIKCPACLHSFLAHQDGRSTSVADAGLTPGAGAPNVGMPPPPGGAPPPPPMGGPPPPDGAPPPPPTGSPPPPSGVAAEDFDFAFGETAAVQVPTEAEDFEFSFGEQSAPPPPAADGGENRLADLFDDLPDLPAPKAPDHGDDFADLPVPRAEKASPYADLPGRRMDADLPAPKIVQEKVEEAPPESINDRLMAPKEALDVPSLPDDDEAHAYATDAPTAEEEQPAAPEKPKSKTLMMVLGVLSAAVLVAGALMFLEIGPFAPDSNVTKTRTPKPKKKVVKKPRKGPIKAVKANEDGMIPTAQATLAEVEGYRQAIGALEPKRAAGKAEDLLALIELYAFGALEFPDNPGWAKSAGDLLGKLDEKTAGSTEGRRATLAHALADGTEEATDKIEVLAKSNPKSGRTQYLLGHSYAVKGDPASARKAFEAAIALDDQLVGAHRMAGELALAAGELETAQKSLEALYARAPGAPTVLNALAAISLRQGRGERANKLVDQILALDAARLQGRDRSKALLIRARGLMGGDQEEKGVAELERAIKAWPGNVEAINLLSERHFAAKDYEKALEQLEALVTARTSGPEIAIKIAECQKRLGRLERATSELIKASQAHPTSPRVQEALGDAYTEQKKFKEAKAAYEKAIEINPKFESARLRMVDMMIAEARVEDAIKYLETSIKAHPEGAQIRAGLGGLNLKLAETSGQLQLLESARKEYAAALALDPALIDARQSMARILIRQGRAEEGLKELEHLAARPDFHGDMSYEFGRAKQKLGKLKEALDHYKEALERDGENAEYLLHAGSAHFEVKDYAQARTLLSKSIGIDPRAVNTLYYLGRIELVDEQPAKAIQRFKEALKLDQRDYVNHYWLGRALEASGTTDHVKAARQEYDLVAKQARTQEALTKNVCDVFLRRAKMQQTKFAEWQSAIEDLTAYTACNPKSADGYFLRGQLKDKIGEVDAAISDFERAIKRNAKYGEAYAASAEMHLRRPKPNMKRIQSLLRKAVRYAPKAALPQYRLCTILKDKNRSAARRHCENYLKLAPKGGYASEAQGLLRNLKSSR